MLKRKVLMVAAPIFLAVAVILCFIFLQKPKALTEDLARLSDSVYDAVFVSSYPISEYPMEDFKTYRGVEAIRVNTPVEDPDDLSKILTTAFSSSNTIQLVYIGFDPGLLWEKSLGKTSLWEKNLTKSLLFYLDAHSDVTFEILLPSPDLSYWKNLSPSKRQEYIACYRTFGNEVLQKNNVILSFAGGEPWLFANPANYSEGHMGLCEVLSHKMILLNFCDHVYRVDEASLDASLNALETYVTRETETPTTYPDLSDRYFVFIGDSVMAYDLGPGSIPGVVSALSGARVANISQGGTPAADTFDVSLNLTRIVDALSSPEGFEEYSTLYPGLVQFHSEEGQKLLEEKKLCFVLYLGLNDYFSGNPLGYETADPDTDTYEGALIKNTKRLREMYPSCDILIMTPNFCSAFSNGTERLQENAGVLTDYVNSAIHVARTGGYEYIDVYTDSGINADTYQQYLADGVHPNETGRFLIGNMILEYYR